MMVRVLLIVFGAYLSVCQPVVGNCKVSQGAECYAGPNRDRPGHTGFIVTGQKHRIPDSSITASSIHRAGYEPKNVRINNYIGLGAWLPNKLLSHQWIQFDLGKPWTVVGVVTKSKNSKSEWVKSYEVRYAESETDYNTSNWITALYQTAPELGTTSLFPGNHNSFAPQVNLLLEPIQAEYIRIYVMSYYSWPSLRADIIGCFDDE